MKVFTVLCGCGTLWMQFRPQFSHQSTFELNFSKKFSNSSDPFWLQNPVDAIFPSIDIRIEFRKRHFEWHFQQQQWNSVAEPCQPAICGAFKPRPAPVRYEFGFNSWLKCGGVAERMIAKSMPLLTRIIQHTHTTTTTTTTTTKRPPFCLIFSAGNSRNIALLVQLRAIRNSGPRCSLCHCIARRHIGVRKMTYKWRQMAAYWLYGRQLVQCGCIVAWLVP